MSGVTCAEGYEVVLHSTSAGCAKRDDQIILDVGGVKATLTMSQWTWLISHPLHGHTPRIAAA